MRYINAGARDAGCKANPGQEFWILRLVKRRFPLGVAGFQCDDQGGAGFRKRLFLHHDKSGRGRFNRSLKTIPSRKRNLLRHKGFEIREIENDQAKSARTDDPVGGPQRFINGG